MNFSYHPREILTCIRKLRTISFERWVKYILTPISSSVKHRKNDNNKAKQGKSKI